MYMQHVVFTVHLLRLAANMIRMELVHIRLLPPDNE
jgi:hypothetical protein